ncbi:hypothetical protein ACJMK2_005083 [Sinanodonta woodiana]|uniref:Tetratricopeptide repeat protein 1 n=1 Tax=Sinanodonta woodiana TaxID=1069815 RepID=A0ABD3VQ94_SINWO
MEQNLGKHQDFTGADEGLNKSMESLSVEEKSSKGGNVKYSQDDAVDVNNMTVENRKLANEYSTKNPDITGNISPKSGNEGDDSNENSSKSECYSSEEDEERCASECECESEHGKYESGMKKDECTNKNESIQGDKPTNSSDTEEEYESAEEGDQQIEDEGESRSALEETLSEEEKEERRTKAQTLKDEGNTLFKSGCYNSAIRSYTQALCICPMKFAKDRAIMYSNRAACKLRRDKKEEAILDCTKALNLHPHYVKALLRRAELYEASEKLDDALADFQKVVELDPSQHVARVACMNLPDKIKERNEKLKGEMIDKLKDLGNLILRPFGLSTDNFKMTQDPNTGGYSMSFQQNVQEQP